MKYLLDTHAFIWWIADDSRFSETARQTVQDGSNQILFSAVSVWEIVIKTSLGKLQLPSDIAGFIRLQISKNNLSLLSIDLSHVLAVSELPNYHKDPFDRLLIAQSRVESIPIITDDCLISRYQTAIIW